jgi:hypothetical protein
LGSGLGGFLSGFAFCARVILRDIRTGLSFAFAALSFTALAARRRQLTHLNGTFASAFSAYAFSFATAVGNSAKEFATFVREDIERWAPLVRSSGATPN